MYPLQLLSIHNEYIFIFDLQTFPFTEFQAEPFVLWVTLHVYIYVHCTDTNSTPCIQVSLRSPHANLSNYVHFQIPYSDVVQDITKAQILAAEPNR